jgi:hypothetical protein
MHSIGGCYFFSCSWFLSVKNWDLLLTLVASSK